jgi:hypothetical protein
MVVPSFITKNETRSELLNDLDNLVEPNGWYGPRLAIAGGFAKIGQIISGLPSIQEVQNLSDWKADTIDIPKEDLKRGLQVIDMTSTLPAAWYAVAQHFGIKYPSMSVLKLHPLRALISHTDKMRGHRVRRELGIGPEINLKFDRIMIPLEDWVSGQQISVEIDGSVHTLTGWKAGDIYFTRTRYYYHWSSNSSLERRYTMYATGLFTQDTWDLIDSEVQQQVRL